MSVTDGGVAPTRAFIFVFHAYALQSSMLRLPFVLALNVV